MGGLCIISGGYLQQACLQHSAPSVQQVAPSVQQSAFWQQEAFWAQQEDFCLQQFEVFPLEHTQPATNYVMARTARSFFIVFSPIGCFYYSDLRSAVFELKRGVKDAKVLKSLVHHFQDGGAS